MPRVTVDEKAPGFELDDFRGRRVSLGEILASSHLVLVFNRGFL